MIRYDDYKGMSFKEICKDQIMSWLNDHEGQCIYGSDIDSAIVESDHVDGTFVLGTESAKEFIKDFWEEASDTFKHWEENMGETLNPFENPEAFTIYMEHYGVASLLNDCEFIQDNWDEDVALTPNIINQIQLELNKVINKEKEFGGR